VANEILQKQGTGVTWEASGGTEVLTLTSLADGAGRQGEEHDFGATHAPRVRIELEVVFAVAPAAGAVMSVYWSSSIDGTNYDAECTGSDAAFDDENDAVRLHLVGVFVVTNDTDVQRQSWIFFLPARYGLPVVMNAAAQALSETAADHKLTVTPLVDEVQ